VFGLLSLLVGPVGWLFVASRTAHVASVLVAV
jgi:hypothetical protein